MTTNPLNIVYLLNSQLFFICLNIDVSCLKLQMKAKTVESLLSCFEFDLTMEDSGRPNSIIAPPPKPDWIEELSGVWTGILTLLALHLAALCWWGGKSETAHKLWASPDGRDPVYLPVSLYNPAQQWEPKQSWAYYYRNNSKKRRGKTSERVLSSKASKPLKLLMPRRISNPFLENVYAKCIAGNHSTFLFPLAFNKWVFGCQLSSAAATESSGDVVSLSQLNYTSRRVKSQCEGSRRISSKGPWQEGDLQRPGCWWLTTLSHLNKLL